MAKLLRATRGLFRGYHMVANSLDAAKVPKLTYGYLMGTTEKSKEDFLTAVMPHTTDGLLKGKDRSLLFCSKNDHPETKVSKEVLPLVTDDTAPQTDFDFEKYKQQLTSKVLGNVMMYTKVAETTMHFIEPPIPYVPRDVGVIAVASFQTHGEAREGAAWMSPDGCAMFSLDVTVDDNTELGRTKAYFQYIGSLAVLEAVCGVPGYEDIDLRLGWPNSIVFGRGASLAGGVLVEFTSTKEEGTGILHANVGCGLYVSAAPHAPGYTCVNDLITSYNAINGTHLEPLDVEGVIARSVSNIEELVAIYQEQGQAKFLERYYRKWMLRNSPVHVESEEKNGVILRLYPDGDLAVKMDDGIIRVNEAGIVYGIQPDTIKKSQPED